MKNKLIGLFLLCVLAHSIYGSSAPVHAFEGDETLINDGNISLFTELRELLETTKTSIDSENSSREMSMNLAQAWGVVAAFLDPREDFVKQTLKELEGNVKRVRRENKLPAWTPLHVLFARTPEELKRATIEARFAAFIKSYEYCKNFNVTSRLLDTALAEVNIACTKVGIVPLRTDDKYEELIALIRQSRYFFMQPFGIARYQAYYKDYEANKKASIRYRNLMQSMRQLRGGFMRPFGILSSQPYDNEHTHDNEEYNHLLAFQKEFRDVCSRLTINSHISDLYARALPFLYRPQEDDEHLLFQARATFYSDDLSSAFDVYDYNIPTSTEPDFQLDDSFVHHNEAIERDLFREIFDILENTRMCINGNKQLSQEEINALCFQWLFINKLISYPNQEFIRLLIKGFEINLEYVRSENTLPAYTPYYVLYAATPDDLQINIVEKVYVDLMTAFTMFETNKVADELLRATLLRVNEAFMQARIEPLKTDDNYQQLIRLVRQSRYDIVDTFRISLYQAYHKDHANRDNNYTSISTLQEDFQKVCSRFGITGKDTELYFNALKIIRYPEMDNNGFIPQAKVALNQRIVNQEDFLPKTSIERVVGGIKGYLPSALKKWWPWGSE